MLRWSVTEYFYDFILCVNFLLTWNFTVRCMERQMEVLPHSLIRSRQKASFFFFCFLSYGHKLQQQDVIFNVAQMVVAYFIFLKAQK